MYDYSKFTNSEILKSYDKNKKCLTLDNQDDYLPKFIEGFEYGEERPPNGHAELLAYMGGQYDLINAILGIVKKHPEISKEVKNELCELIRDRSRFYMEMDARWEASLNDGVDFGGFKGVSSDMYEPK